MSLKEFAVAWQSELTAKGPAFDREIVRLSA
jgi:hypothetical protein